MPRQPGVKKLTLAEIATINTLKGNGFSIAKIAELINRHPDTVRNTLQSARELMDSHAKEYAEVHMLAAKNAAAAGNSKPAEWALERLKVVEPAQVTAGNGFTVNIGVAVPGLGTGTQLNMPVARNQQAIESGGVIVDGTCLD